MPRCDLGRMFIAIVMVQPLSNGLTSVEPWPWYAAMVIFFDLQKGMIPKKQSIRPRDLYNLEGSTWEGGTINRK